MASELHSQLCDRSAEWLAAQWRCAVVAVEPTVAALRESPDAFGWDERGGTHLVEVKVSRADFLRDQHKPHRGHLGIGEYRWYVAPEGVIEVVDLPPDWGLATPSGEAGLLVVQRPASGRPFTDARARQEVGLLACMIRRSHGYKKLLRINSETLDGMVGRRLDPAISAAYRRQDTENKSGAKSAEGEYHPSGWEFAYANAQSECTEENESLSGSASTGDNKSPGTGGEG